MHKIVFGVPATSFVEVLPTFRQTLQSTYENNIQCWFISWKSITCPECSYLPTDRGGGGECM